MTESKELQQLAESEELDPGSRMKKKHQNHHPDARSTMVRQTADNISILSLLVVCERP
jgi:hypothetical protein